MTGGMPSTAAVNAASQAQDYYNAKMADKIPELYTLAYQMYADEEQPAQSAFCHAWAWAGRTFGMGRKSAAGTKSA